MVAADSLLSEERNTPFLHSSNYFNLVKKEENTVHTFTGIIRQTGEVSTGISYFLILHVTCTWPASFACDLQVHNIKFCM